jgi:hypothetical protein
MKKETNKKMSVGKAAALGAGLATLGTGAYYLLGPNGKKNQKKAKVWMTKMEKDVLKKIVTIKDASEPIYHKAVDSLAATYAKEYNEYAPEIKSFATLLKKKLSTLSSKPKPVTKKKKPTSKKANK